jgi:UDP-glucose 4-epimerase
VDPEVLWRASTGIPWGSSSASAVVSRTVQQFLAASGDERWQILWCAGAGVIGTTADDLAGELAVLRSLLASIEDAGPEAAARGSIFVASSAGGLYAGSKHPPFTEASDVRPISAYGDVKLAIEQAVRESSARSGIPALIGRISNLYGPGQNLRKPQGLISQICRAHLLRRPISIYVPLDTLRDYLYVEDCGRLVVTAMERMELESQVHTVGVKVKLLASQRAVTIGTLLAELNRICKRRPLVVHGSSINARYQVKDLRLQSAVWPELDGAELTPLPVGIERTIDSLARELQLGVLR